MARRTKEDAAITREQLLDAAEKVFRRRGVARSSLAEVASVAGVTRGAVYWHFRDKADLCSAVCERSMLPLETMLEQAGTTEHDDPVAMLRKLALTALTRLARDPRSQAVYEVMLRESGEAGALAPITERKRRERRHCLAHVERVLQQAVAKGQLPPDTNTALATQALHAYIGGIMHEWVLDRSAFDLAETAPALVDSFLAGLRTAPPRNATADETATSARAARRTAESERPALGEA